MLRQHTVSSKAWRERRLCTPLACAWVDRPVAGSAAQSLQRRALGRPDAAAPTSAGTPSTLAPPPKNACSPKPTCCPTPRPCKDQHSCPSPTQDLPQSARRLTHPTPLRPCQDPLSCQAQPRRPHLRVMICTPAAWCIAVASSSVRWSSPSIEMNSGNLRAYEGSDVQYLRPRVQAVREGAGQAQAHGRQHSSCSLLPCTPMRSKASAAVVHAGAQLVSQSRTRVLRACATTACCCCCAALHCTALCRAAPC